MPSVGSITKTIRINAEDKGYMERLMEENGLTWSGVVHYLVATSGTPSKKEDKSKGTPIERQDLMDKAVEKDLVDMCRLSGISTHDFFRGVCELWNDGEIGIDGEKVRSLGHYNIERFVELCHIMNIKPQETIDKITRSMEKGV